MQQSIKACLALPNRFPEQPESVFPANRVAGIDSTCCVNHRRGPETAALGAIWRGRRGRRAEWKGVWADITLYVWVEILFASTYYWKKNNPHFFFPSLPRVLSVLYRGTGADAPYFPPSTPPPCIFDWHHPCQSAHVEGGKLSGFRSPPGKGLTGSFWNAATSQLLSESLLVNVGAGSVELSNGSRSAFNHTTLCRIDTAAELRLDYWWVPKVYFRSILMIRSLATQSQTLLFPRCDVTKGIGLARH